MLRRLPGLPLALALVLAVGCGAQRREPEPWRPGPDQAGQFFWRVEHGGNVSYVFGTIHLGVDLDRALGPAGLAALGRSRTVFVEMDLSDRRRAQALGAQAIEAGRLPASESLRALLGPDLWARLRRLLPAAPPGTLDRTEPWLAALTTLQAIAARSAATPATAGANGGGAALLPMDVIVVQRARRMGARVIELDSMQQQLRVFQQMPRRDAVAMLGELLRDPDRAGGELRGIVTAYGAGDAEHRMEALVDEMARRNPTFAEHLFFRRNHRWTDQLDAPLRAGGAFVAVGAGHLVGPRGVPALLAARGFAISRLAAGDEERLSLARGRAGR